jgi:hypothetical protein
MLVLAAACNAADQQPSGGAENRALSERRELAELPNINRHGTEYPYMRYSESTGQTESHGQIFYLYPTTRLRNQLVALEYEPGARVEGLVVEEILGSAGLAVVEDGKIRIDFMPISVPRGVAAGQEWRMQYASREFTCRSRADSGATTGHDHLAVSCSGADYTLNFRFNRERGVTEYQDFCGHSICTFSLTDPFGLLSRATLEHMGLPAI